MTSLGLNAQDACRSISTEAANIAARGKAAGGLLGFLNPQNWGSSSEVSQQMKNILGVDMSSQSLTDIKNMCSNTFIGSQSNIIDVSNCPACQTMKCTVSGNRQTNTIKNMQTCGANSVIDKLKEKKGDLQALAAMKAIQDAQGLLAGNKANTDMCNFTSVDMSSQDYINALSSCGNVGSSTQENILRGCADFIDNIQSNDYDNYQRCVAESTFTDEAKTNIDAILSGETSTTQNTTGLDIWGFFSSIGNYIYIVIGGSVFSSFMCMCCCVMLFAILLI